MAGLDGQQLGQYRILSVLGEGGMATVYRARQDSVNRDVAIKVIESKLARNPEFLKRFRREAETVAALDHPHIVKVFDYGQSGDLVYLVMQLLAGGSLADLLRKGPMPLNLASRLFDQIADALDYAHEQGVIHRDLKPGNVLLDSRNNGHLTDFGIAKLLVGENTALTQTGMVMGTPAYMSPEQWQGKSLDAHSDIYTLGIILFEMLTGRVPFQADTPFAMMHMHIYETPPPVRTLRSDTPDAVGMVVEKALAKKPEDRFSSAGEMAEAFKAALQNVPPAVKPKTPAEPELKHEYTPTVAEKITAPVPATKPRNWVPLLALLGVLVIGGAAVIGLLSRSNRTPTPTGTPTVNLTKLVANLTAAAGSWTPTPTKTPSVTPSPFDPRANAIATNNAEATRTATHFTLTPTMTLTPTVDLNATVNAERTKLFEEQQAANATATAIIEASYTRTLTSTSTATFTPTSTPSLTLTPTSTATSTSTPTATATFTPTPTPSSTPTSTVTPTSTPSSTFTPTILPEKLALTPIANNTAWKPVESDFLGVTMVLVPAGCFQMGSNDGENDEKPVTSQCFDQPFWIDKYEVTEGQFKAFGGQAVYVLLSTGDNRPVVNIIWFEARDFCAKRGARLPTEAEWEYAARGPDSLIYPWGNTFDVTKVKSNQNSVLETADVGSIPGGRSWVGALDLGANVSEWTNSIYKAYPYEKDDGRESSDDTKNDRVVRGGISVPNRNALRSAVRSASNASFPGDFRGFRCVRS
jgi:eukaryotic-like serine/threonine-protein kinase